MDQIEKTVLLVAPGTGLSVDEFAAAWNAHAAQENLEIAVVGRRPGTYNADLLDLLGHAADFVGIAAFVGVPTVASVVASLRGTSSKEPKIEYEYEEVVIERPNERIKKITIRRS